MTELLTRPAGRTARLSDDLTPRRRSTMVGPGLGVMAAIGLWWLLSVTLSADTASIPRPPLVMAQLVDDLADAVFWSAIVDTATSAVTGYGIGVGVALALAMVVLMLPRTDGLVTQVAVVCSCVPVTAVAPLITLMSEAGSRATSVFLAALGVTFPTVIGALLGLRAAHPAQLDVVRVFGGTRWTELMLVRSRAAMPAVLTALRIAAPAAFLGAVLGEYFLVGVDSGLGILLLAAQATSSSVKLGAIALICGAVPGIAYWLIGLLARVLAPWSDPTIDAGGRG